MSLIKIKQLNERVSTAGLFMGTPAEEGVFRRKLEPGEIVHIPDDMMEGDEKLMEMLYETGHVDLVPPSILPTRLLDSPNRRFGQLCSPTFKPRDPTDQRDMEKARLKEQTQIVEQFSSPPEADSPDEDDAPPAKPPVSRRGRRRAIAEANKHGEAHTA